MACRLENDKFTWRQEVKNLVEGNIPRVLPTSVHNALGERLITRCSMGLLAFIAQEILKECLNFERYRDEPKTKLPGSAAAKQCGQIHKLETTCTADTSDNLHTISRQS
jgi:hypothetical protein